MNSKILHKYEKIYYVLIKMMFLLFLIKMVGFLFLEVSIISIVNSLAIIAIFATVLVLLLIQTKTKKWRSEGTKLTKEARLGRITILPSNLLNRKNTLEFEIHHTPFGWKRGLKLKKEFDTESKAKEQLYKELKMDYLNLSQWALNLKKEGVNVIFHTTTHESLAHIWKKTSDGQFYMKELDKCLDNHAKMNLSQWIFASYSTTGRMNLKKPKVWKSYIFFPKQSEVDSECQ